MPILEEEDEEKKLVKLAETVAGARDKDVPILLLQMEGLAQFCLVQIWKCQLVSQQNPICYGLWSLHSLGSFFFVSNTEQRTCREPRCAKDQSQNMGTGTPGNTSGEYSARREQN